MCCENLTYEWTAVQVLRRCVQFHSKYDMNLSPLPTALKAWLAPKVVFLRQQRRNDSAVLGHRSGSNISPFGAIVHEAASAFV